MTVGREALVRPSDALRRSPIYRWHLQSGAAFSISRDIAYVSAYGTEGEENVQAARLGLADLSTHPRTGVRGPRAQRYLNDYGLAVPSALNTSARLDDGSRVLRLSDREFLILGAVDFGASSSWIGAQSESTDYRSGSYRLPREDTHGWLALSGRMAPGVLAKLCGVDMRPHVFPDSAVAQTSVARVDAIVARGDIGRIPCFHLLSDICSTEYLWHCLLDAMAEFGGKAVGSSALAALESRL